MSFSSNPYTKKNIKKSLPSSYDVDKNNILNSEQNSRERFLEKFYNGRTNKSLPYSKPSMNSIYNFTLNGKNILTKVCLNSIYRGKYHLFFCRNIQAFCDLKNSQIAYHRAFQCTCHQIMPNSSKNNNVKNLMLINKSNHNTENNSVKNINSLIDGIRVFKNRFKLNPDLDMERVINYYKNIHKPIGNNRKVNENIIDVLKEFHKNNIKKKVYNNKNSNRNYFDNTTKKSKNNILNNKYSNSLYQEKYHLSTCRNMRDQKYSLKNFIKPYHRLFPFNCRQIMPNSSKNNNLKNLMVCNTKRESNHINKNQITTPKTTIGNIERLKIFKKDINRESYIYHVKTTEENTKYNIRDVLKEKYKNMNGSYIDILKYILNNHHIPLNKTKNNTDFNKTVCVNNNQNKNNNNKIQEIKNYFNKINRKRTKKLRKRTKKIISNSNTIQSVAGTEKRDSIYPNCHVNKKNMSLLESDIIKKIKNLRNKDNGRNHLEIIKEEVYKNNFNMKQSNENEALKKLLTDFRIFRKELNKEEEKLKKKKNKPGKLIIDCLK